MTLPRYETIKWLIFITKYVNTNLKNLLEPENSGRDVLTRTCPIPEESINKF